MGIRQFNAEMLAELRDVTKNKKLRQKDIQEWSTGPIDAQVGEAVVRLPRLCINVAYKAVE